MDKIKPSPISVDRIRQRFFEQMGYAPGFRDGSQMRVLLDIAYSLGVDTGRRFERYDNVGGVDHVDHTTTNKPESPNFNLDNVIYFLEKYAEARRISGGTYDKWELFSELLESNSINATTLINNDMVIVHKSELKDGVNNER